VDLPAAVARLSPLTATSCERIEAPKICQIVTESAARIGPTRTPSRPKSVMPPSVEKKIN
jgi:hypothetical protein